MALNGIADALTRIIPSNADSIFGIKNGKTVSVDEVQCIYNGKIMSIWKKQKYYYIAFSSNGGSGKMEQQTMPCGTAAALPANLFTRIGYLFQGWNPDPKGDAIYSEKQEVTDAAGAGETKILHAIWKAITWYVKFNANGGSGSMSNQAHVYDGEQALSANTFTRNGYSHIGWGTSPTGAVAYTDKAKVKNLKSVHGAVLNLYALWQRVKTVLFDTGDSNKYNWIRSTTPNNGWGTATCYANGAPATWNKIDCTDYNYCTVRIKGSISSEPSGATVNNTYIKIGFTTDHNAAISVVRKTTDSSGGEGQEGVAYNKWYDLTLDVSNLTGIQTLNVFIGGAYQNGGTLYCSKITMSVD